MTKIKSLIAVLLLVCSACIVSCGNDDVDIPEEVKQMYGTYQGKLEIASADGDTTMNVVVTVGNYIQVKPAPLLSILKPLVPVDPNSEFAKELASISYSTNYAVKIKESDSVKIYIPNYVSEIIVPQGDSAKRVQFTMGATDMESGYSLKNNTLSLHLSTDEAAIDGKKVEGYKKIDMWIRNARKTTTSK